MENSKKGRLRGHVARSSFRKYPVSGMPRRRYRHIDAQLQRNKQITKCGLTNGAYINDDLQ